MDHRLAVGTSMIALIIGALLASGAGIGVPLPREASAAVATSASPGERSVERIHSAPLEHEGVRRTAFVRAATPATTRIQTPSGSAGSDGPRVAALGAEPSRPEVTRGALATRADVRGRRVPLPGHPALSSRAPPA